jgi:hypothetical protein
MAALSTTSVSPRKSRGKTAEKGSTTVLKIVLILATIFGGVAWSNSSFQFDPSYLAHLESLDVISVTSSSGSNTSPSISKNDEDLADRVRYLETKLNAYLAFT